MYNEFYSYIFPDVRSCIINAIEEAEMNNETYIIIPMSTLISLLYNQYDPYLAINIYLKDPLVSDSVTRKHFFELFQEEVKECFQEEKKEVEKQNVSYFDRNDRNERNDNNNNEEQNVIQIEPEQSFSINIDFDNYSIYL